MTKRMLIDAAHPEETRVVVIDGNHLVEFDYETSTKKKIKGNIYLAKVTRVEPSLQAAFVEYGGNRHGFLAFNEIHPDYYRIPVADREAVLEAERVAEADENRREEESEQANFQPPEAATPDVLPTTPSNTFNGDLALEPELAVQNDGEAGNGDDITPDENSKSPEEDAAPLDISGETAPPDESEQSNKTATDGETPSPTSIEILGGDEIEEARRPIRRPFRHYKIQEVIKRRQIMLVQVTKEERGNKGAALTTYISVAGRYCVLMPNTPRGGGVSRKITSPDDRRRLKNLMSDLEVPEGMGVIVRTAGSERSKAEIERDLEYLRRLWDDIRELTLKSTAPALIYEEGNIIKRAIRDLYTHDIDEIVVDGETGYHNARSFMQLLMPNHAKHVKFYLDPSVPLFQRYQIEAQLDAIYSPTVQLKSGGYIVINATEALVAIDVNSGRSTRERNIEETATKTNLEAAEEIARQLRLRDLAGLIVIDFIDMEVSRNQHAVERRFKEAMRSDRARIQIGRISPFGLLELSRQRLRPSLLETSTELCPYCGGTGHIRSTESTALHVLRAIEEEGVRRRSAQITVAVPEVVALYILNQKRPTLQQIETRCGMHILIKTDATLVPPHYKLERLRALTPTELAALPAATLPIRSEAEAAETGTLKAPEELEELATANISESAHGVAAAQPPVHDHAESESGGRRRRRRRGRRGGRTHHGKALFPDTETLGGPQPAAERAFQPSFVLLPGEPGYVASGRAEEIDVEGEQREPPATEHAPHFEHPPGHAPSAPDGHQSEGRRRRRRGRRGGRRRRGRVSEHRSGERPADIVSEAASEAETFTPSVERHAPSLAETLPAPEPEPIARKPDHQSIQHNVPPTHDVTGHAVNPRKGWWRR